MTSPCESTNPTLPPSPPYSPPHPHPSQRPPPHTAAQDPHGPTHRRDHRSRSGLPRHPGKRDAVFHPHEYRQHLSALDHGNIHPPSFGNFGIIKRDRGTGHDNIRA